MTEHIWIFCPAYLWAFIAIVYIIGTIETFLGDNWKHKETIYDYSLGCLGVLLAIDVIIMPIIGFMNAALSSESAIGRILYNYFTK